jgi:hypothetical protein
MAKGWVMEISAVVMPPDRARRMYICCTEHYSYGVLIVLPDL